MRNTSCILNYHARIASLCLSAFVLGSVFSANTSADTSTGSVRASTRPASSPIRVPIVFWITVPDEPNNPEIWISGNFAELGSWNGRGLKATTVDPQQFEITHSFPPETAIEFKVTRGSWETVEKGPRGEEIPNRRFLVADPETIQVQVANWRDFGSEVEGSSHSSTLSGNMRSHEQFRSEYVSARDVLVCLPPKYDEGEASYPVLYMHDGQNIFDEATSFLGVEWGVDETLIGLVNEGAIEPIIIVGIYNNGAHRIEEYTQVASEGRGGGARSYGRFLTEELKPFIDREYRTRPGREDTGVAGSSLGGLVSLYLGLEFPDHFSKVAAISPSVWWADGEILDRVSEAEKSDLRLWLDVGTAESATAVPQVQALRDALIATGWKVGPDFRYLEAEGAGHDERAWADRVDDVLRFLYPSIR